MITPEDILETMDLESRKVCENTFLQERPNATDPKLTEFIVVSLPYSVTNKTMGEKDDWWIDITVVLRYSLQTARRIRVRKSLINPP